MRPALRSILSLPLLATFLASQPVTSARFDIDGVSAKVEFTNLAVVGTTGQVAIHGWDKVNGKYRLYNELGLSSNGWKQVGIRFTPLSSGEIALILQGVWKQAADKKTLIPLPVYWDLVEVQGATLKNADFEELDEKGSPRYWSVPAPLGNADDFKVVKDKAKVKAGAASVTCWQNQRLGQSFKVVSNTPVTITVWALPGR